MAARSSTADEPLGREVWVVAAYATLESSAVPRATSALNVLQRIGGSLGTALLAVVLQGQISDQLGARGGGDSTLERLPAAVRERVADPLASAFASTFWWAVGMSLLALIPATILALVQRRDRRDEAGSHAVAEPDTLPV